MNELWMGKHLSSEERSDMRIMVPQSADKLDGPFIKARKKDYNVLAKRNKALIIEFISLPDGVKWFDDFEFMYCLKQHDRNTFKVIRKATNQELKEFRVPIWIQDEDVPKCCGKAMHFVGQIDDEDICSEGPKAAKKWWHDSASFYVFTCSRCLKCKAVGQQY